MPPVPVPFGKYQLLDRIAAGGMAEIYRAVYQAGAGVTKPVVIKKILPHYAGNKNFISMFVNEAKIAVTLSHGNIAQVFDFGDVDGEYFLAMEFVHGHPLSKVLRRGRHRGIPVLPIPFAVLIAMELCKGLHYAHSRLDETGKPLDIIHRDVSPQNIIISYEGQVKIVDFGIAKARNAGDIETESGAVKGKYVYFAPEQARGKEVDARTDIFAAGIVLYEMLCGKLPFEGRMMDVLGRIIRGEMDRPRAVNPNIPVQLERVVMTALATDKAARFQTAQDFQDALARYLYTHVPTFSTAALQSLMSFLYERDLVAEGMPVKLPPDFLEQMEAWKNPPRHEEEETTHSERPRVAAAKGQSGIKTMVRSQAEISTGSAPRVIPSPPVPPDPPHPIAAPVSRTEVPVVVPFAERLSAAIERATRQLPRRWLFIAAPAGAMAIAAAVVLGFGFLGGYSIELTSTPPNAVVLVDGHPASQVTPLLISGLSSDAPHLLQVQAPGRRTWTRKIPPARGVTLSVHAELEPEIGSASSGER